MVNPKNQNDKSIHGIEGEVKSTTITLFHLPLLVRGNIYLYL